MGRGERLLGIRRSLVCVACATLLCALPSCMPQQGDEGGIQGVAAIEGRVPKPRTEVARQEGPLVLRMWVEKDGVLCTDASVDCHVELHNVGDETQIVYLPALEITYEVEEEPGRMMHSSVFVVKYSPRKRQRTEADFLELDSGDYWGHVYRRQPFTPGTLIFRAVYDHQQPDKGQGPDVWLGKLAAELPVKVVAGDKAMAVLAQKLAAGTAEERADAAFMLGFIEDLRGIPLLLKALGDAAVALDSTGVGKPRIVCREAAYALEHLADVAGEALDPGLPFYGDEEEFKPDVHIPQVRAWAERYLKAHPELKRRCGGGANACG